MHRELDEALESTKELNSDAGPLLSLVSATTELDPELTRR
jgi:hypothetical protein